MKNLELAIELFRKIKNEFPQFKMDLLFEHKDVESMLDIPVQKGILIPINLNLQNNDELHLQIGNQFWLEWFPCDNPVKVDEFYNAVHGILTGEYRILTFRRWGRTEKSHLQMRNGDQWETIGRYWRYFYTPFLPFGFEPVVLNISEFTT